LIDLTNNFARWDARRDRLTVASCIVGVGALAWVYLVHLQRTMTSSSTASAAMGGMGMVMNAPWRATDVFFTFAMWSVMMIGMMTPAATPMLLIFASTQRRRAQAEGGVRSPVLLFALGYMTVWLGFSAAATLAQWALHDAALLSASMAVASPRVAGALLVAAGVYQLTPAKRACLEHCQSPLGFLMSHWRDGPAGTYQMGIRHGIYCLGCCWALMAVLFAVGVMNLAWVGALTVFILLERLGGHSVRVARLGAVLMIGLGVLRGLGAA
jgi:predicted metal-binding membrane protein